MTWFKDLTGFEETSPSQVRENMLVERDKLISRVNGCEYQFGSLETLSLAELRGRVRSCVHSPEKISVNEVVADIQDLHSNPPQAGALFQVASQFNLLEMVTQDVTPEEGVGRYENDRTQGPACAIACGAGTIYRNYFASINGRVGQSRDNQIDCLVDLGAVLGNSGNRLWKMKNGYTLASHNGLVETSEKLKTASEEERDELRKLLRIGIQWNTQVTIRSSKHTVTQAYCSALPVSYSRHPTELWEDFARLVLEASYEATLCAAILNSLNTGNNHVYLTLLGGGAFGNDTDWILDGLNRALKLYKQWDLNIAIVSYGSSKSYLKQLAAEYPGRS